MYCRCFLSFRLQWAKKLPFLTFLSMKSKLRSVDTVAEVWIKGGIWREIKQQLLRNYHWVFTMHNWQYELKRTALFKEETDLYVEKYEEDGEGRLKLKTMTDFFVFVKCSWALGARTEGLAESAGWSLNWFYRCCWLGLGPQLQRRTKFQEAKNNQWRLKQNKSLRNIRMGPGY